MSNRVKSAIALTLAIMMMAGYGYLVWDSSHTLARQWIALGPIRWVDFASGAFAMFILMLVVFVGITLRETNRFDREVGGGDGGNTGGSGGKKQVRLPMRGKIIDIAKWQPPDGRYHRGVVSPA